MKSRTVSDRIICVAGVIGCFAILGDAYNRGTLLLELFVAVGMIGIYFVLVWHAKRQL